VCGFRPLTSCAIPLLAFSRLVKAKVGIHIFRKEVTMGRVYVVSNMMTTMTMMMMTMMMDCRGNVLALSLGHTIAQAVSLRPFVTEIWAQSQVSPCGICGGRSGHGTGLFQNNSTGISSSHMHLLPTLYNLCN